MCDDADSVMQSILSGNGLLDSSSTAESDGTQVVNRGENGIWVTDFELNETSEDKYK